MTDRSTRRWRGSRESQTVPWDEIMFPSRSISLSLSLALHSGVLPSESDCINVSSVSLVLVGMMSRRRIVVGYVKTTSLPPLLRTPQRQRLTIGSSNCCSHPPTQFVKTTPRNPTSLPRIGFTYGRNGFMCTGFVTPWRVNVPKYARTFVRLWKAAALRRRRCPQVVKETRCACRSCSVQSIIAAPTLPTLAPLSRITNTTTTLCNSDKNETACTDDPCQGV
jgi:hypothetical protein